MLQKDPKWKYVTDDMEAQKYGLSEALFFYTQHLAQQRDKNTPKPTPGVDQTAFSFGKRSPVKKNMPEPIKK